jgi:integrase
MESQEINFNKRDLEALKTPKDKRLIVYDAKTRGLAFLIQPNGKSQGHRYFFWLRKVQGRPRWETIGDFPDLSVDKARAAGDRLNTQLAEWKARGYPGRNPFEKTGDPTLGSLHEDYCDKHLEAHAKNPGRAKSFAKQIFDAHLSRWRNRKISSISQANVRDLHFSVKKTSGLYAANRVVQDLRATINWSIREQGEQGWKGENPAVGIELFKQKPRKRYLSAEETKSLIDGLDSEPNRDLADFIALALFTGARKSDVTSMRWIGEDGQPQVNFELGSWLVPDPKNEEPYTVPLVPQALEILRRRKNVSTSPWVFPGPGPSGHVLDFKRSWGKFLTRVKITNFRQHDLRHTLGSVQANQGTSLPIIGASLGHKSLAATKLYAHLQLAPVRASVENAVTHILSAGRAPEPPRKRKRRKTARQAKRRRAVRR